jgi:hypothetical protein
VLGMGEGKVRYRTSSLPKNRSGSGEVISAGTFLVRSKGARDRVRKKKKNVMT